MAQNIPELQFYEGDYEGPKWLEICRRKNRNFDGYTPAYEMG